MKIGIVGLGRMGTNLGLNALEHGHEIVGFDADGSKGELDAHAGFRRATSLRELASVLERPRKILTYIPHGAPTDSVIGDLLSLLAEGDLVADGGNSHWRDSVRHFNECSQRGVGFLDVGTSGGVSGARHGACFMVGGEVESFRALQPLLNDLAVPGGVLHAGPAGAGHFVKLVHNAIEFGMLQAIGEGVDLLLKSDYQFELPAIFENWSHGSVIRGWLVELMEQQLRQQDWEQLSSYVVDTREVAWIIEYALQEEVWIPAITASEMALYRYRDPDSNAGRAVSLMRHGFGGHPLINKGGRNAA